MTAKESGKLQELDMYVHGRAAHYDWRCALSVLHVIVSHGVSTCVVSLERLALSRRHTRQE
jgi:hypothetical protein